MMKNLLVCLIIAFSFVSSFSQAKIEVTWYDAAAIGVDGRGWTDTKTPYDRFPPKAQGKVPEGVWTRSLNSAGMNISFATDSDIIVVRWKVRHPSISTPFLSSMSVAGLDLYVRENNKWMWAASKAPRPPSVQPEMTETFLRGLPKKLREFRLYLPSYNGVEKVEIGVSKDSKFGRAVEKETKKPLVIYGSSIIQGSASSRPGMTLVAQLGRRLNRNIINLGFAGLCKMEPALGDLLAELDPAMFVIDCLPNMVIPEINERTVDLVKKIRKSRPETPIVVVENPLYSQGLWNTSVRNSIAAKNKALAAQFAKLQQDGIKNIYYIKGDKLYGEDGDSSVDGVHPTDYGFKIYADNLEPFLKRILEEFEKK